MTESCWRPASVTTSKFTPNTHLCAPHTDDPVDVAASIVEEGNSDGVFAGRQPVAFGGRVDLEDMSSGTEDGLLPARGKGRVCVLHLYSTFHRSTSQMNKKL